MPYTPKPDTSKSYDNIIETLLIAVVGLACVLQIFNMYKIQELEQELMYQGQIMMERRND